MELIIGSYIAITVVAIVIGIFIDCEDKDYPTIILWPIWLIKIMLKSLFKLLFTDWK